MGHIHLGNAPDGGCDLDRREMLPAMTTPAVIPSPSPFQLLMELAPLLGREVQAHSEDGYVCLAMSGSQVCLTLDPRCIDPQQPQRLAERVVLTHEMRNEM